MNIVINALLRATLSYVLLLTMTRLMGRKALSQMTFFDFAVSITMGAVAANIALGPAFTLFSASLNLVFLALAAIVTGLLRVKSFRLNKLVNSEPVIAIENGEINERNIKKVRMTLEDLTSMLREKNIFNMADVEFAVIENDGVLSVLPKSQKQPVTPSDLKLSTPYHGLSKEVVIDGEIQHENLEAMNLSSQWLLDQLKIQGFGDPKEVFFAALDTSGSLYISKRHHSTEKEGQHGIE